MNRPTRIAALALWLIASVASRAWAQPAPGEKPTDPTPAGAALPIGPDGPADSPAAPEVSLPDPDADRAGARARKAAPGDEVVVVMNDGQRLVGRFVSGSEQAVVVNIGGVGLTVQRADFERLIVQRPMRERYREMRSMIDDGDVPRLLLLAEWLRANGLLDDALVELEHVRKVEPTNVEASRLRQLVDRQLELRESAGPADAGPVRTTPAHRPAREPAPDAPPAPLDPGQESGGVPLLTPEQVNLMKVFEVDLGGSTKFIIERQVVERLLRDYAGHALIPTTREGKEQFLDLPPAEILNVMFRVQARELYSEVKVQGNPPAMKQFRDNVNRAWLVTTCASPACHGGASASALQLVNRRTTSEQSFYTNFLILDRYRLDGDVPLIDYDKPERSPLLQMALPRAESARPHPEVQGWQPAFRTVNDRRFLQAVDWISAMYRPRPEYPIEYPPGAPPAGRTFENVPR